MGKNAVLYFWGLLLWWIRNLHLFLPINNAKHHLRNFAELRETIVRFYSCSGCIRCTFFVTRTFHSFIIRFLMINSKYGNIFICCFPEALH
jgi:hypothetical protein